MKKFSFPSLLVALLFTLILDTISCTKEYSYEGKPMAVYNLTDVEDRCIDAVVKGNYVAGATLDSSHYVYITANVTKAGNYTIQTNVVNGISFMAVGNFPDTGSHTVILKATGKPDSTGVFKLNVVGDNGCFFSVEVVSDQLAEYVLLASPGSCETFEVKGLYILNKEMDTSNIVTVNVEVLRRGNYALTTDTLAGIFFSATGFFNTTGKQTVRLRAVGTAKSSGLFYFKLLENGLPCDFKIPIQNAEPLAIYALVSLFTTENPCILKSVSGDYITAIPLSANNTIELFVFVFQTGNFTISTDRTNGIIFSNTGKFDRLGEQIVTLSGTGIPISSGLFSFIPQIIGPAPIGGYRCNINLAIR